MLLGLVALRIACRSVDFQATPVGRSVLPLPFPRIRHGYSPRRHSFLFFGTGQALLGSRRLSLSVDAASLLARTLSLPPLPQLGLVELDVWSRLLVGLPPRIRFLSHICFDLPRSMSLTRARPRTCTPVPTPPCVLDCLSLAWAVQGHPERCSFRGGMLVWPPLYWT